VLGDADAATTAAALRLAQARGWPVVAEPSASAGAGTTVVEAAELVLRTDGWLEAHRPDRVLVVGRPTLSRAVGRLVGAAPSDVVATAGVWSDPGRRASRVLPAVPSPAVGLDPSWLPGWLDAGKAARAAVDEVLVGLSEPVVAAEVLAAADRLLVVGSSKPVRDLFLAGARPGVRVLANRGAAGIDGTVSTAWGAALAAGGQAFALLGDLTFLHDSNGMVVGPDEPRPDLTFVVVNNDGGAIFGLLEQGAPEHAAAFERVFGTPHGVDLAALCRATATPYRLATTREELRAALRATGGVRVVEVRTDRHEAVELDRRLRAAVATALA
jgi:2-succinyl-5-enolpyruvyl-6-hydroxy-3-cyclohexene-1-carboxylate synthase